MLSRRASIARPCLRVHFAHWKAVCSEIDCGSEIVSERQLTKALINAAQTELEAMLLRATRENRNLRRRCCDLQESANIPAKKIEGSTATSRCERNIDRLRAEIKALWAIHMPYLEFKSQPLRFAAAQAWNHRLIIEMDEGVAKL